MNEKCTPIAIYNPLFFTLTTIIVENCHIWLIFITTGTYLNCTGSNCSNCMVIGAVQRGWPHCLSKWLYTFRTLWLNVYWGVDVAKHKWFIFIFLIHLCLVSATFVPVLDYGGLLYSYRPFSQRLHRRTNTAHNTKHGLLPVCTRERVADPCWIAQIAQMFS